MIRNVVFMGTPDFAVGTLNALTESGKYCVKAVFSQPDKPKGRRQELQPTPVKEAAARAGIPVFQPARIREPKWLDILRKLQPDVIVVVAFGQIIPQTILDLPPYGCVNVHASLLPKYRGAAPIQWAVINGEKESGVTTMRMDAGLDTGDMILCETVTLAENETAGSLFDRLSAVGASLLLRTLDALSDGTAAFEKQPAESPTPYAAMLRKEDGCIDWGKSARSIECLIRGMNPWPCAFTRRGGKLLKIWGARAETENRADPVAAEAGRCTVSSETAETGGCPAAGGAAEAGRCTASGQTAETGDCAAADGAAEAKNCADPDAAEAKNHMAPVAAEAENCAAGCGAAENSDSACSEIIPDPSGKSSCAPGTVVSVKKDALLIQTGDGLLALTELQPEGKKRMPVSAYLRGYPVKEGERFG